MAKKELSYEIIETVGVLSEGNNGWQKELNIVKWGDNEAKYDIRSWDENHEKMGKGITLSDEEAAILKKALAARDDI